MELIVTQFVSGVVRAAALFLTAAGLSLVFGVVGVLNLAHVSLYMLGAYLTFSFWKLFESYDFGYWIAIPLTCLAMVVIGALLELTIMRRLYQRSLDQVMVATFALILIIGDVVKLGWGPTVHQLVKPAILHQGIQVGGASYAYDSIFVVALAVIVFIALWFWLTKTRSGRIVTAAQFDREMVDALGIPISRVFTGVFVLGTVVAALAGASWMCMGTAKLGMEVALLVQIFCVMIVGGLGSFMGTAVAALIIGLIHSFGILILPDFAIVFPFLVTGIVLLIRPRGLFGVEGRK